MQHDEIPLVSLTQFVLHATADLIAEMGMRSTTLAHVAQRTGVSTTTIRSLVGSLDWLVSLALLDVRAALEIGLSRDQERGVSVRETVMRHLARLTRFADESPGLASAILLLDADATAPERDNESVVSILRLLEPSLATAQRHFLLSADRDLLDLSEFLTLWTLRGSVRGSQEGLESVIETLITDLPG
jgi:AcrR family transcriptional regulator